MNRFWRLDARPHGLDLKAALSLQTEDVPEPGAGEVLVKASYLSMDAGTRMWMSPRTDGYQPPLPLGAKMSGLVLGHVAASRHPDFQPGQLVRGFGQWADYALVDPALAALTVVDADVPDIRQHFGALGLNAWTALVGIRETMRVQSGEWMVVSAAAGATGSLACQIGRNLGIRVIGIAGGPEKCRHVVETLGAEFAIDYKAEDVEARLAQVEGGIHAYFDNVGGDILDAVLPNMTLHGRVGVCGLISHYDSDTPKPGPRRFDQVLMKRLRIEGFFLPDYFHLEHEARPLLRQWHDEGRLTVDFDETVGLARTLDAYLRMLTGKNIGKVIVKVAD